MKNAPIVLFVYRREDKLKTVLESLLRCPEAAESDLIIFSDGSKYDREGVCKTDLSEKELSEIKGVRGVRRFLDDFPYRDCFHSVRIEKAQANAGLASSVIGGVGKVVSEYGRVIVLEDDLSVTPDFLTYMNGALDFYENDQTVGSISGFVEDIPSLVSYEGDVFATGKGECWGWATWSDRFEACDWEMKDFEAYRRNARARRSFNRLQDGIDLMLCHQMSGKLDSWAVRWCFYLWQNNLLTIYPRQSRVVNNGLDGSGTHCERTEKQVKAADAAAYETGHGVSFEKLAANLLLQEENAHLNYPVRWRVKDAIRILFHGIK